MDHPIQSVAVIGAGRMGGPMALNLLRAGFVVRAYDTSAAQIEALTRQGVTPADSAPAAARAADTILTMLPSDEALDRVVAVKVLAPQLATNATARTRFSRESKAAAGVVHDHVVGIHAVEVTDSGVPYLVMQFISGKTLQERLKAFRTEVRDLRRSRDRWRATGRERTTRRPPSPTRAPRQGSCEARAPRLRSRAASR